MESAVTGGHLPKLWLPAFGIDRVRRAWDPEGGPTCPPGHYVLSRNVGDDLQTLAVERLARAAGLEIGYYERDTLVRDGAWGAHGNVLCLVGWFSHSDQWPPPVSGPWVPLFLGYHDTATPVTGRFDALRELAEQSPWVVGCRDRHTVEVFKRAGVPADRIAVSGCATLTLPKTEMSDTPLTVDVPEGARRAFLSGVSPVWEQASHWMPTAIASDPVLRRAEIQTAIARLSRARVVATTRLHAALPALAAGRKVIFLCREPLEARLRDFVAEFPVVRTLARLDAPVQAREVLASRIRPEFQATLQARAQYVMGVIYGLAQWKG